MQSDRNRARPQGRALPFLRRDRLYAQALAILLACAAVVLLCGANPVRAEVTGEEARAGTADEVKGIPAPRHPRESTYMKRKWGVEILFVRRTAAGYMIEFRYKVLDPEKAKPLFTRKTKPVMTHVETGTRLAVPTPAKTGALRNSDPPVADRTYWMFFANNGNVVQPGDRVDIQIGDFLVEGLVVQ